MHIDLTTDTHELPYSSLTHLSAISPMYGNQYLPNPSWASFQALNAVYSVTPIDPRRMMSLRKYGRRIRRLKSSKRPRRGVVSSAD
jgi:hypothetical protein